MLPLSRCARRLTLLATTFLLSLTNITTSAAARPDLDPLLSSGKFDEAQRALSAHLESVPNDDLARFQLGTVQLLRATELLAQDASRYGARTHIVSLPFVRLGGLGGKHPAPQPVTYQDVRAMIARFQQRVAVAEQTLATIQSDTFDWRLDFSSVAFDLNGDGKRGEKERLDDLFRRVARISRRPADKKPIVVDFDAADARWLRGYCHVLQALADMTLAYDHQGLFDVTAHVFFKNPQTDYAARWSTEKQGEKENLSQSPWGIWEGAADLIAAIHLMDFKLVEPDRMRSAHQHLLKVIKISRETWQLIGQETDQRNEWIPSLGQTSVIPGMLVGPEQLEAWQNFLNEAEAMLKGKKLAPFWRSGFTSGVNIKRMLTEPRDFDLVLWLQGSAALPYLESGEQTDPEFWRQLQRTFRGRFFGFALWTN